MRAKDVDYGPKLPLPGTIQGVGTTTNLSSADAPNHSNRRQFIATSRLSAI
jgi:hypothetical protein